MTVDTPVRRPPGKEGGRSGCCTGCPAGRCGTPVSRWCSGWSPSSPSPPRRPWSATGTRTTTRSPAPTPSGSPTSSVRTSHRGRRPRCRSSCVPTADWRRRSPGSPRCWPSSGDLPHVASVADPFTAPGSLSQDGRTAYATVSLDVAVADMPVEDVRTIIHRAQDFAAPRIPGGGRWRPGPVRGRERGWCVRGRRHPGRAGDPGAPVRIVACGNSSAVDRGVRGRQHARPAGARVAPVHRARLHGAGDDAGRSRRRHRLRVADLLPLSP